MAPLAKRSQQDIDNAPRRAETHNVMKQAAFIILVLGTLWINQQFVNLSLAP
jgi:hypothetical protein